MASFVFSEEMRFPREAVWREFTQSLPCLCLVFALLFAMVEGELFRDSQRSHDLGLLDKSRRRYCVLGNRRLLPLSGEVLTEGHVTRECSSGGSYIHAREVLMHAPRCT